MLRIRRSCRSLICPSGNRARGRQSLGIGIRAPPATMVLSGLARRRHRPAFPIGCATRSAQARSAPAPAFHLNIADVAKLVNARDLKSAGATDPLQLSCKTYGIDPAETAGAPGKFAKQLYT